MLFNSFDFGFFLVIVFAVYWILGAQRRKSQNLLLLVASYVFYGLWDWRFLSLLFLSSVIDFLVGRALGTSEKKINRKLLLWCSILWNLGVLITFKYFNFFLENFAALLSLNIPEEGYSIWKIMVPVGLSFYTFQTMGYSIDVYRRKISPTKNFFEFLCFVSFFPQLVAGPIERAKKLLPQFEIKREFSITKAKEGLRQILWGLFKKILVADKLGIAVTMVFSEPDAYGFIMLSFAAVLFSFQMYCDFSGYTDIAIGTAKLFGFRLSKNFRLPYFARSITEFWQRWHITLTQWFTDYVYIPLVKGARRITVIVRLIGLFVTMFLVGLWHGANWTFVAFGIFNGIILAVERIPFFKRKGTLAKKLQKTPRLVTLIYFFTLTSISSIFFRSESIDQAFYILKRIFTFTPDPVINSLIGIKLGYLVILLIAEIATRTWDFPLQKWNVRIPKPLRWAIYYLIIIWIIRYAEPREAFLYFQF